MFCQRWVVPAIYLFLLLFVQTAFAQVGWWKKYTTPGTDLTIRKSYVVTDKGETEYHYFFQAKGFPAGRKYVGLMRNLMSPDRLMGTGIHAVGDQGNLISGDGTEFELVAKGFLPGETIQLSILEEDTRITNFVQITPIPLEGQDGACRLYAILLDRQQYGYELHAVGFTPRKRIQFHGDSEGEVRDWKVKTDKDGSWLGLMFPAAKGKASGMLRWQVQGESCSPTVQIPWRNPGTNEP